MPLKETYIKRVNGKEYLCHRKSYEHQCKYCNKTFYSHKNVQHYCSRSCKSKDYSYKTRDNLNGFSYNDESFFENKIDTENKAYVLGLFMADGSISNNQISISLNDLDIIEQIRDMVNPNRKVYHNKNSHTIVWRNKEDLDFLKSIGVTIKKSYDARIYFGIPKELMHHYIRGWFDGDGCVFQSKTHDKKTNKDYYYNYVSFTTGSVDFIKDLQTVLSENGISTTYNEDCRKATWYVTIKKKGMVQKFFQYIYKDANIKLNRKYYKFMR